MRNCYPSTFLLLPHGHPSLGLRPERLALDASPEREGIAHHEGVAVHFARNFSNRIVLNLQLLELLECLIAIKRSRRRYINEVRCKVRSQVFPILLLHISPQGAFEAFATGRGPECFYWPFCIKGTPAKNKKRREQCPRNYPP